MACRLVVETDAFQNWDTLINRAERHGLGPLVYRHLKDTDALIPQETSRALQALFLRHRHANAMRGQVLKEILCSFAGENIPVLALKGAALASLVYQQPGLRSMRDIDLLVKRADAQRAQSLLSKSGFLDYSESPLPKGHHHLSILVRKIEGITVCVEIHEDLFPTTRYYHSKGFEQLIDEALEFQVDGVRAYTLGYEDMLWHIYRHAIGPPLLASPLRFIHIADIVSLVEAYVEQIDWALLRRRYPQVINILPTLHFLTPLSAPVLSKLGCDLRREPQSIGVDYQGWPRRSFHRRRWRSARELFLETIAPPEWWQRLYYGVGGQGSWLWSRYFRHPLHLLEWIAHYARQDLSQQPQI